MATENCTYDGFRIWRIIFILYITSLFYGYTFSACNVKIPNCSIQGRKLYCDSVSPGIPQFIGADTSGCEFFYLQNEWTLYTLPQQTFRDFKSIKHLGLSNAGIRYLGCNIFYDVRNTLEVLDLKNNLITEIVSKCTFEQLTRVKRLRLEHNEITNIEGNSFLTMDHLEILNISYNLISGLTEKIIYIERSSLKYLDFSHNEISIIHGAALSQHSVLEELNLSDNRLRSVNDFFMHHSVKKIDLSRNHITNVHTEVLSRLGNLTTLLMRKNSLSGNIWESLKGLGKLKILNLAENDINVVDSNVLNSFRILEELDLSHNLIQSVYGVKPRSGVLRYISFSHNRINLVHDDFFSQHFTFSRTSSVTMDFSHNFIKRISVFTHNCEKPCFVYLQNNLLDSLTFSQINIEHFHEIDIRNNNFKYLSDTWPYSKSFLLSNNPISSEDTLTFMGRKLRHTERLIMSNSSLLCNGYGPFNAIQPKIDVSTLKLLDLSQNCLNKDFFCKLKSTTGHELEINLDRNGFTSYPDCIELLSNNVSVSLKLNNIRSMNYGTNFGKLSDINLEGNLIPEFPFLLNFTDMNKIRLPNNKLLNIADMSVNNDWKHGRLHFNKEVIDLSNNKIQSFQKLHVIHKSTDGFDLRFVVDISQNSLQEIPEITDEYETKESGISASLDVVYRFGHNLLTDIKTINFQFTENLNQSLDLNIFVDYSYSKIGNVSKALMLFTGQIFQNPSKFSLTLNFDFSYNNMTMYPSCEIMLPVKAELSQKNHFKKIQLSYNHIWNMPGVDSHSTCYLFTNILNLKGNNIQNISDIIGPKTVLNSYLVEELYLKENVLEYIADFAFNRLGKLRVLDLSSNKIIILPNGLNDIKTFEILDISDNFIVHFTSHVDVIQGGQFNVKNNPIDCSCVTSWLRNYTLPTDDARCASPSNAEGFLVTCYPIDHCLERFDIHLTKETIKRCSLEEGSRGVHIDIKPELSENDLWIRWKTFPPFNSYTYRVRFITNDKELYRSDTLQKQEIVYRADEVQAEEVCVSALNNSLDSVFERCVELPKLVSNDTLLNQTAVEPDSLSGTQIAVYVLAGLSAVLVCVIIVLILFIIRRQDGFRSCRRKLNKDGHASKSKMPKQADKRPKKAGMGINAYEQTKRIKSEQIYDDVNPGSQIRSDKSQETRQKSQGQAYVSIVEGGNRISSSSSLNLNIHDTDFEKVQMEASNIDEKKGNGNEEQRKSRL